METAMTDLRISGIMRDGITVPQCLRAVADLSGSAA